MHSAQEPHDDHLGVTLTTVTGSLNLGRLSDLHEHHERHDVSLHLVQSGIYLAHVVPLLSFSQRLKAQRLGINRLRNTQDIEDNPRGRAIVSLTDNHTVTNNNQQLTLVIVLHLCDGIDGTPQRFFVLSVGGHLTHDELVETLRHVLPPELKSGEKLESNNRDKHDRDGEQEIPRELTLDGISGVDLSNVEETIQTSLHVCFESRGQIEGIPVFSDILSFAAGKQICYLLVHEIDIDAGGVSIRAGREHYSPSALVVLSHVIDLGSDDGHVFVVVGGFRFDVFGRVSYLSLFEVGFQDHHLLVKPVGSGVIGKVSEIVILGILVDCRVRGGVSALPVKLDRRINRPVNTGAKSGNLHREQVGSIHSSIVPEPFLRDDVGIVRRYEVGEIKNDTTDCGIGRRCDVVFATVVGGKLCKRVDVLLGTDHVGKYNLWRSAGAGGTR
jgi:hypothetical protein